MEAMAEPSFAYNPHDPRVMENPLPYYEILRDDYPMYYVSEYDAWAISRFEDVYAVLSDRTSSFTGVEGTLMQREQFLKENNGVIPTWSRDPLPSITAQDSPDYELIRQAQSPPLRPRAVASLDSVIRDIVERRLDELLRQRSFNVTVEYGGIIAASVMCHLLGLPSSMAREILETINVLSTTDPETGGLSIGGQAPLERQLRGLLMPAVERGRERPGESSLVDGVIAYRQDGHRALSDEEVCRELSCVLVGGTETLPKIVAHGLLELWQAPEQRAEVVSDLPANCATAFNEMTRFCAPAQWFSRTVRKPIVIAGQDLRVGQRVILLLYSASHDPREFESPDEFRWSRSIRRSLAFGFGQHHCIGIHLAKLEGRILLESLLRRVPDYEIDLDGAVRPASSFQWGYSKMPLIVN